LQQVIFEKVQTKGAISVTFTTYFTHDLHTYYTLYCVVSIGCIRGAAAEVDTIGEQQLKCTGRVNLLLVSSLFAICKILVPGLSL